MTCVGPSSPVFKRNKADFAKPSDAQKTAVLLALSVAELKIRQSAAPWTFAACSKSSLSSCSSSPRSTCPPAEAFARHLQLECQPRVAQRPALADRLARLDVVRKTPPATACWFHRLFRRHLWAKVIAVARRRDCFLDSTSSMDKRSSVTLGRSGARVAAIAKKAASGARCTCTRNLYSRSVVGSRPGRDVKGNAVRASASNLVQRRGCPRNCRRRAFLDEPLEDTPGRSRRALSREPGDLPATQHIPGPRVEGIWSTI